MSNHPAPPKTETPQKDIDMWGRRYQKLSFSSQFYTTFLLFFSPIIVLWYFIACNSYDCAVSTPVFDLLLGRRNLFEFIRTEVPQPTWEATKIFVIWEVFQALLYVYLPGPIGYGQETPAGYKLPYNVNGLRAWILTHVVFFVCVAVGLFPATIVYDNWGPLLAVANIFGYFLATFCWFKAWFVPTHNSDVKWSGYPLYDYFMGAEFNPRIGTLDFKLFFNGRPGILGWNIINLSYAAAQYKIHGYISNSMVLVLFLHLIYILDFFYNEDWYLRTIDIAHDHFGWLLAWGDSVWLPWMYTLQGFYLCYHPYELGTIEFALVLGLGLLGYYVFRVANNQKNDVRLTNGQTTIWGKPAEFIEAHYKTGDGKVHRSLLLTSGFWGWARHFNYFGDLLLSFAYCAACGWNHMHPYFYIIQMTCLLLGRIERDQGRCHNKYGVKWEEYCKKVPYKLIPYIY